MPYATNKDDSEENTVLEPKTEIEDPAKQWLPHPPCEWQRYSPQPSKSRFHSKADLLFDLPTEPDIEWSQQGLDAYKENH